MAEVLRYRGRVVTSKDVVFIRRLIARAPQASRRRLSAQLCEAWDWRQPNGALRDMVCRGLMLALDRERSHSAAPDSSTLAQPVGPAITAGAGHHR